MAKKPLNCKRISGTGSKHCGRSSVMGCTPNRRDAALNFASRYHTMSPSENGRQYCPQINPAPVEPRIVAEYKMKILEALQLEPNLDTDGNPCPHVVTVGPDAMRELDRFAMQLEKRLGPGGDFESMGDWAGNPTNNPIKPTAGRRSGIAKQFFKVALRRKLVAANPFEDLRAVVIGTATAIYELTFNVSLPRPA